MIPMLDCSPSKIDEIAERLGCKDYGQLCTPLTGYCINNSRLFAIDNGGYTKQDPSAYLRLLKRAEQFKDRCKFVVAPDVPGSAIRTIELLSHFEPILDGWPVALAAQDGVENVDIPWNKIQAIFIAGTDAWRKTDYPKHVIAAAKWRGLWVHVGRVSNPDKWAYYEKLGADSADSSIMVRDLPDRIAGMKKYFNGGIDDSSLFDFDNIG